MSTDENKLCRHSHGRQHGAHCITFGDAENGMDLNQRRRRRKKTGCFSVLANMNEKRG